MSKQQFSSVQREAIWSAHGGKCAYSRVPLEVGNFHIDHIIPESLVSDPEAFERVKSDLLLPHDFDPLGYSNLLPCSPATNLQKRDVVFEKAQTQFFLGIAANRKIKIEENILDIEKRISRGRASIVLQQFLEAGKLTPDDVARILRERPDQVFKLTEGLSFADRRIIEIIGRADIEDLRRIPIRFGEKNDHITSLTLTNENGETQIVRTCQEYEDGIAGGYYPYSTYDIKVSSSFEHQCGLLRALKSASLPSKSFISEPRAGVVDLNLLPFSLFPSFDGQDDEAPASSTYQEKVDQGKMLVKSVQQNLLHVQCGGMGQLLIEAVRADFNGDGFEDVLLFEYVYATEGTLGYGAVKVVTRTINAGLFEII